MAEQALTQREHRTDEHRGLPLVSLTRSGYMAPEDKRRLETLWSRLGAGDTIAGMTLDEVLALLETHRNEQQGGSLTDVSGSYIPRSYLDTDEALTANSDTKLATQQATKAYADTKLTGNAAIVATTKTKISYDSKGLITAGADATAADVGALPSSYLDTDGTLAANSNTKVASQKATKTYADGRVVKNASITAGTKTRITYDEKGLVTAGADATYKAVVPIKVSDAIIPTSYPATKSLASAATNFTQDLLTFADGAQNQAYWQFVVPSGFTGADPTGSFHFLLGATTNSTMYLEFHVCHAGTTDAWDWAPADTLMGGSSIAYGGAAGYAAGDIFCRIDDWTDNKPTAGDLVVLRMRRWGASAFDTLAETLTFMGGMIEFPCSLS